MCLSEEQEISVRFRGDPHYKVIEESGLSRFIWDEEHVGSNPTYLTYTPLAQSGRAVVLHTTGRRFKSYRGY